MNTVLKKNLKKIENLADEKEQEIKRNYYLKYNHFYKIAIKTLKKYDVLLYGGTAINELFPKKYKFYSKEELPDIDIFCTEYEPIALDILSTYNKQGYKLTTIKEALHPNTYKIMVEGLQLIDITVVDPMIYETLKKNTYKTKLGLTTVNIDYLKYSMHDILSKPLDSFRWTKVFQRLVRFYEVFPIDTGCSFTIDKYYVTVPEAVKEHILDVSKKLKLISFGWDIIRMYIQEDDTIAKKYKTFLAPLEQPENMAVQYLIVDKNIDAAVKKFTQLTIESVYPGDYILPKYYVLKYQDKRCLYIFESDKCVSYLKYKNKTLLSIHSLIAQLYAMFLSTGEKDLYCVCQILTVLQMNNALSTRKLFQQFILNCYGFQKGLVTLRKERFERKNISS